MKHAFLPLTAALTLTPLVHAEDTALPEVVITATRLPKVPAPLPNSTVITREEIDTRQPSTLAELLQQEAGIAVARNGGALTNTGVFLRGAATNQVLVLVDGVRMNDANQGGFDFSLLRPDEIERIEIVRGPYSAQYGSDAIGGVIQIFTRQPARAEVSVRAGRSHTQEYGAGARLGDERNGLGVQLGYLDSDGFTATTPASFSYDPDRDGGLARYAQLSGQARLSNALAARFSGRWKESRTEFDTGLSDQALGSASVQLEHTLTAGWTQTLQLGWLHDTLDTDGRSTPFFPYYSRFFTRRDTASWLHELHWTEGWRLVAGLDFADEQAQSRDLLAGRTVFERRQQNAGVFATQYAASGIYSGSASLRADHHDSFGSHATAGLTLAAQVLPSTKLFAGYGSAFRAPSANDLYYPGDPAFCFPFTPGVSCYAGNPALQPETAREGEAGVELRQGRQRLRLSAYRNRVRDLIAYSGTFPFPLVNVDKARLQGMELDASGRIAALAYRLNASSQSAEDGRGNDLPRRPQGSFNATLDYTLSDRLHAGTEIRARSSSRDAGRTLGGYTAINLFAGWQVLPALNLGARLENAGNKRYAEVAGYQTAPRSGYLTASWRWR